MIDRFVIVVRVKPGPTPPEVRLRRALKLLLRRFGIEVEEMREVPTSVPAACEGKQSSAEVSSCQR